MIFRPEQAAAGCFSESRPAGRRRQLHAERAPELSAGQSDRGLHRRGAKRAYRPSPAHSMPLLACGSTLSPMTAEGAVGFLGRASERQRLDRLLASVRDGHSAALVIRGEAGIGKTALLTYAAQRARGFDIAQIAAVEAE